MVSDWLEAGLRARGHAVVSRRAADEAWGAYEEQHPTLVLLDWAGQDGADLCRRIRAQASGECCVVLAMGLSDRLAELEGALDLGADDYFPKMADAAVLEGRLAVAERRVRQIEARTSAAEAVKRSERRYRDIVERAWDVIAAVSPEGPIPSSEPALETVTDRRPADLIASAPGQDGRGASVLAIACDVTERRRAQRCQATRRVATHVLSDAASLTEAAAGLLQALCVGLGWGAGLLWSVDPAERRLRFVSLWHLPGVDASALLAEARTARPRPGEGRVGEAWLRSAALWTEDDLRHGMRAGLVVPIKDGAEVVGALQLLSPEPRQHDPVVLRTVQEIAAESGTLVARQQAEEALRGSQPPGVPPSARGDPSHEAV